MLPMNASSLEISFLDVFLDSMDYYVQYFLY